MVLICPHCAARSRVHDDQAKKPMAEVMCGGCSKRFFVSAAYSEAAASEAASPGIEHAARLRQRTAQLSPARRWVVARAAFALGLPVALALFALWDLGRLGPLQPALSAQLQVVGSADKELTLQEVTVAPYAPTGGQEGLLVRGKLMNGGGAARRFVPVVAVQAMHPDVPLGISARLRAGAQQTLQQAPTLAPLALHEVVEPLELPAHGAVPFIGLLSVPEDAGVEPWQVAVKWLSAEQGPAQVP